jgi:hypothetical protein
MAVLFHKLLEEPNHFNHTKSLLIMITEQEKDNIIVWDGKKRGHYEVYYLKFNDTEKQIAFWIRYTFLIPKSEKFEPVAEVWAIYFDKKNPSNNSAWKETYQFHYTEIEKEKFRITIAGSTLTNDRAVGSIGQGRNSIYWDISFQPQEKTFKHFPKEWIYKFPLPKTKLLAPNLSIKISGRTMVKGITSEFKNLPGHQAHIWGTKHAQKWAWANCNYFNESQNSIFEALTAQIKIGPILSPKLTLVYCNIEGENFLFNNFSQLIRNESKYNLEKWNVKSENEKYKLEAEITNGVQDMVGVMYVDPDGKKRFCNNTKVADMKLTIFEKINQKWIEKKKLTSNGTTAFEVTDIKPDKRVEVKI